MVTLHIWTCSEASSEPFGGVAELRYKNGGNSCLSTTILEQDLFYSSYTLLSLSRVTSFSAQKMKGSLQT